MPDPAPYRAYPAGAVFTGTPADVTGHLAALTPAHLTTVKYIDYPYWTDFSGGARLAIDGVHRLVHPRTPARQPRSLPH
jgi:hypothetical protein